MGFGRAMVLMAAATLVGSACGSDKGSEAATTAAPTEVTAAPTTTAPTTTAPTTTATTTTAPTTTGVSEETTTIDDSFEDNTNQWDIIDDPQYGSTTIDNGDYVWDFSGSIATQIPESIGVIFDRGDLRMQNVAVQAEVTIVSGDGVVGVSCRWSPDTDAEVQWYEFVARDGYAAIRRSDLEGNIDALAEDKDVDLPTGQPFTITGTCTDAADGSTDLSLSIGGAELLTYNDTDPLGNGLCAIGAYTHPIHAPMNIVWHSFSVSAA